MKSNETCAGALFRLAVVMAITFGVTSAAAAAAATSTPTPTAYGGTSDGLAATSSAMVIWGFGLLFGLFACGAAMSVVAERRQRLVSRVLRQFMRSGPAERDERI